MRKLFLEKMTNSGYTIYAQTKYGKRMPQTAKCKGEEHVKN